ncbi:MAG: Small heat shock protein [Parcubacteria group bacterium GW2011_GWC2_39_14]|nr:MAG: Small heat shock protein [Parcubacteria group bacterium GW2011_GWC2_39_14]KKR54120.1 MAG: Small heat shock protein [Parcubacteria group bacterium GW2011_GWA2_40_23]
MDQSFEPNWQEHLDDLESLYHPDNFFFHQKVRPTAEVNIRESFAPLTLMDETEIPEEGQLAIDIFQDQTNIYVLSPIAGTQVDKIEISLDKDILTIRGARQEDLTNTDKEYIYRECYWGRFSRSVVLPLPVKADKVMAELKNGVLKVTLPKAQESDKVNIPVQIVEE